MNCKAKKWQKRQVPRKTKIQKKKKSKKNWQKNITLFSSRIVFDEYNIFMNITFSEYKM